jgi:HSP20 family molecular chaperone IbpA
MNDNVTKRNDNPRADLRSDARAELPSLTPRVDVLEDETGITLLADLPGVSREALDIKVEGDQLLLDAALTATAPEGMEATYAEVRVPRYRRSFTLSRELDTAHVQAALKDGVLTLRIPKQEKAQPRRIAINVA